MIQKAPDLSRYGKERERRAFPCSSGDLKKRKGGETTGCDWGGGGGVLKTEASKGVKIKAT